MLESSKCASRILFQRFLFHLLRFPLSFFERTPFGQILNRCSNDFDMIDNNLMFTLRSTFNALIGFLICVLLIAYFLRETIPIMILIFLPFIFLEVNTHTKKNSQTNTFNTYFLFCSFAAIFALILINNCIYILISCANLVCFFFFFIKDLLDLLCNCLFTLPVMLLVENYIV